MPGVYVDPGCAKSWYMCKHLSVVCDRRSACDRCRGQKLRCVRSNGGSLAILGRKCERCRKAGADCISTPAHGRNLYNWDGESDTLVADQGPRGSRPLGHGCWSRVSTSCSNKREYWTNSDQQSLNNVLEAPGGLEVLDPRSSPADGGRDENDTFWGGYTSAQEPSASVYQMSTAYEFDVLLNVDEDFPGRQQVEPSFSSPRLPSAEASQNASSETGNEHLPSSSNATAQSTYFDQDRLLKLSSLIPDLIADFNRINALHLSDILSYNSNANTLPSSSAKNMIGRVMDCSQRFLDAFQHPSQDQGKAHQSHQHHDEQDMPQPNPSSTGPAYESGFWKPPNEAGAICALQSPASAPKYDNPSSQHSSSQQHARTHIDLPSSLTILTCYIWLLRTYDSIFTKLYTVLEPNLPVTHGSPDTLPSVLPGLWIGGFGLDNNRTIQIEILLQLSSRMIERIESVLGMNLISPCDDGSLDLGLELDKAPHLQPRSPVTPPSLSPSSSLSERSMVFNATATNALMGALQEQSSSTASAEMNVSAGWKPHDLKQTMRRIQDVLGARQV